MLYDGWREQLNRNSLQDVSSLVTLSVFDSEAQRAVFAAVAASAESILYGAERLPAEHLDRVLRDGHDLLAQLPDGAGS